MTKAKNLKICTGLLAAGAVINRAVKKSERGDEYYYLTVRDYDNNRDVTYFSFLQTDFDSTYEYLMNVMSGLNHGVTDKEIGLTAIKKFSSYNIKGKGKCILKSEGLGKLDDCDGGPKFTAYTYEAVKLVREYEQDKNNNNVDSLNEENVIAVVNDFANAVINQENRFRSKEEQVMYINSLFSEDAILSATVSNTLRKKKNVDNPNLTISSYFSDYFSSFNIKGLNVEEANHNVQSITLGAYLNKVQVIFTSADAEAFVAEMTFVVRIENGVWKILSLDSNKMISNKEVPESLREQGDGNHPFE